MIKPAESRQIVRVIRPTVARARPAVVLAPAAARIQPAVRTLPAAKGGS